MEAREPLRSEKAGGITGTDYRVIFDAMDDAVFIHDAKTGDILDVNQKMCEMFGYSLEVARGLTIADLCGDDPVCNPESLRRLLEAPEAGERPPFEWRAKTSSGRRLWTEVRLKRLVLGGKEQVLAIVRDISRRKAGEEALKESETRFRLVTEGSLAGVYLIQNRRFVYANPTMAQIFGYPLDEILSGRVESKNLVHPEDLPLVQDNIRRRLEGELKSVHYTFRGLRKDGTVIHCEVLGSTIEYQGHPAVMGTLLDITSRVEAEENLLRRTQVLEALVQASPVPIINLDTWGQIQEWNPAAENLFGWRREEVLGKPLPFLQPGKEEEFRKLFEEELAGEGHCGLEIRGARKDGSELELSLNTAPLYDVQGRLTSIMGILVDITGVKRAERALKESEARYRAIVEDQAELITRFLPDLTLTFVNEACARFFNKSREELLGKSFLFYIPEEDQARVVKLISCLSRDNPVATLEHRVLLANGETAWQQWTNRAIFDGRGQVVEYQSVGRDITARRLAEEALRDSEERYRALFQNNHAAMLLIDPASGAIVDANPAAANFYGYTRDQLTAKKITDINVLSEEQVFQAMARAQGGQQNHFFFQHCLSDGAVRHVEVFSGPIRIHDRELLYSIVHDVTARSRAEEALRQARDALQTLVQTLPLAIVALDRDLMVTAWNPAAQRIFGWTENEVLGRKIPLIPKDQWTEFAAMIKWELKGERQSDVELRRLRKDGSLVDVCLWTAPLRDARGEVSGSLGIFADITARREAEAKLKASEASYRTIFNAVNDAIAVVDLETGNFLDVNQRWCEMTGFTPREARGLKVSALCVDDDPEYSPAAVMNKIRQAIRKGPQVFQWQAKTKEGRRHWVEVNLTRTYINGQDRLLAVMRDISERRQAEEALKASEAKYRTLVEQVPAITYVAALDDVTTHIYISPQIETLLGWTQDEWLANPDSFKERLHPEDRDRVLSELILSYSQGGPFASEYRLRSKSGQVVWVRDESRAVYDADGLPLYMQGVALDITDRKQAEEALLEASGKLRALVQASPLAIIALDDQGRIMSWNPAAERIFGWRPQEVMGRPLPFIPKAKKKEYRKFFQRVLQGETLEGVELRRIRKDNVLIDVSLAAAPLYDAEGNVAGVMGVLEDITGRKHAEEELRRQAELLDLAHDAIVVRDQEDRIIFWNRGATETYGWEKTEAQGKGIHDLLKTAFPQPWGDIQAELLQHGQWQGEIEHTTRDGRRLVVASRWVLRRDSQDQPLATLEINRDITMHRRAEAAAEEVRRQQEAILSNISDIAWLKDRDSRFIVVNEPFGKACGVPLQDLVGKTDLDIWPPDLACRYREDDQEVMQTGKRKRVEEPLADKEGRIVWIETIKTPIFNERGEVIGTTGIARDITRRRQMEEALRESEQKLRLLTSQLLTIQERERRRLSRELHDELGQALTVLKIHLVGVENKLRRDQPGLKENCEQLLNYIDGVIENVRRLSWDLSPTILEDLGLSSSLGYLLDETCRANKLSCSLSMDEVDNLFSTETRINIYRIFQESLNNVIKHAGASHVAVTVKREGPRVAFIIRDDGRGFDQKQVMARDALTRGLGLTAMNERARLAGGVLRIWSQKDKGTRIAFRIPIDS